MVKRIFLFFFVLLLSSNISFAYNKTELSLRYNNFYEKLEKKLKDDSKIVSNLEKLDKKISDLLLRAKSPLQIQVLRDLSSINKLKISDLKVKRIKEVVATNTVKNTSFVQELVKNGYKSITLNDFLEYKDSKDSKTYRFVFKNYYEVNEGNYKYFIKNRLNGGYLVRYKGGFLITNDYKIERKYTYDELYDLFSNKIDYKSPYILVNGEYYTYRYNYHIALSNAESLYLSDLAFNGIYPEKTLLIKDLNGKYFFSNDYKKIRLTSESIVEGITNKENFLSGLLSDITRMENNYDHILFDIKKTTLKLIKNKKTDEEKIQAIYKWIVDNVVYYENYKHGNEQNFSGVLTYKNKTGVCEGYTRLFLYMLSFAGISDVEIKVGYNFSSPDFPGFGHAWVRIGDYYYDPTFDDPIGNTGVDDRKFMYFKLPHDLMYTDRFDGIDIPEKYLKLDLTSRKKLAMKNLYDVYDKYKTYPLLSRIKNRMILGLRYDEDLTIDLLKEKVPFYDVNGYVFYDDSGERHVIASLKYYVLKDGNLDSVLSNPDIDLKNAKFFKWHENGKAEYRLAYNLKYR